jgi:rhodanese-related sulfurtransferase
MSALNIIPVEKLARLIGTATGPAIIDVRTNHDFAARPLFIPGAIRRPVDDVAAWAAAYAGRNVVVACSEGHELSHGAAAWLRQAGAKAEALDGGIAAWAKADLPMVREAALPPRDTLGRTLWVTRARPKVDRIACPWLIRRFVDPDALFLFVAAGEVAGVAERFGATPFDVEGQGIVWSHDGDRCTFDVMVDGFGLGGLAPLAHLARIVRGADTARLRSCARGRRVGRAFVGLARMFDDDLEQLGAGMLIYDALYRWCRDATGEKHDWVSHQPKGVRAKVASA